MAILVTEGVGPAREGRKSTLGVGGGLVAEGRAVCVCVSVSVSKQTD